MAGLAAIASVASAVVGAAGTVISGLSSANAAEAQGEYENRERLKQAGEARAAAQREAIQRRREARLAQSRTQAVASASGGGASDPGVIRLQAETGAQGRYNAASAIYEGDARGRAFEVAGDMANWRGKADAQQARLSSFIDAGSMMLSGLSNYAKMKPAAKKKPLDLSPYNLNG